MDYRPRFCLPNFRICRWTKARQVAAKFYDAALVQNEHVDVPHVAPMRTYVYHLYTIRHRNRDALAKYLGARGIQTSINYPSVLPLLPAYQRFGHRQEQFPNAYADQNTIISLPMFAEISREQQEEVVREIRAFQDRS